jgi:hypothetical protein
MATSARKKIMENQLNLRKRIYDRCIPVTIYQYKYIACLANHLLAENLKLPPSHFSSVTTAHFHVTLNS